ncbi:hypothetical protein [Leucobacter sp. GX24907]
MANVWGQNEEKNEEDELVVTTHRDEPDPAVTPAEEQAVEVPEGEDPRDALDALGEDVSSSPARRGREDLQAESRNADEDS